MVDGPTPSRCAASRVVINASLDMPRINHHDGRFAKCLGRFEAKKTAKSTIAVQNPNVPRKSRPIGAPSPAST